MASNIENLKAVGVPEKTYRSQLAILNEVSEHVNIIYEQVNEMVEARKVANALSDIREKAISYCDDVKGKYFDIIRYHVDKLESLVDDEEWTLPKYREMLFLR